VAFCFHNGSEGFHVGNDEGQEVTFAGAWGPR
jgi:hypothetical protein